MAGDSTRDTGYHCRTGAGWLLDHTDVFECYCSPLRMVQWRGVGMGSGMVIVTLPVSPGEPSSVLSPLSYLTKVKSRTLLNIENSRITTVRGYRSYFSCP